MYKTLIEIRQAKAAKIAEMRTLLAGEQSADSRAKFDALKAEVTELEAAEQRQQFLDEQDRRAIGVTIHRAGSDTASDLEQRVSVHRVLQAAINERPLDGAEAEYMAEHRSDALNGGIVVPLAAFEKRANTTTSAPNLVGTDHRGDQFIGPLRASLLVRQLGVRTLSGLTGNVSIPKYGTGLSAGWVAEGSALAESAMGFEGVTLSPKHVGGISEMSRQLIQQSSPDIEGLIRDDLSFAIASAVDAAIIAGAGGTEPTGIIGRADVQTAVIPATWSDVLDIEQLLAAVNVSPSGWYTNPAVLTALRKVLKSATAGSDYIATAKSIGELSAYTSSNAPAGTAILGDWSQVLVGQWGSVELLVNPYAETPYRRGGVLVRAMSTVDVAVRHEKAFVVATASGG